MGGTGEGSPRESELKRQKLEPQHEDEEFIVDVGEDVTEKATKSCDDVEEVEGSMETVGGEDPKVEEEEEEEEEDDDDEDDEEDKIVTVIKNYEGEDKCVYGSIDSDVDEEEQDDDDRGEEEEDDDEDDDEEVARYSKQLEDSDGFYVDHVPKFSLKFFPRVIKLTLNDDISYDKKLEELASIAVEVYNHQKAANLKFEKLLFATLHACGTGEIFYITFSANNLANHKAATYQSIVYRGFCSHGRYNIEVRLFRRKPKWCLPIV